MVEHPLQRMRVEHLQQKPAHAARHHAHQIGVDHTDRRIFLEQGLIRRGDGLLSVLRVVEHAAHLINEAYAQGFDRTGHRAATIGASGPYENEGRKLPKATLAARAPAF